MYNIELKADQLLQAAVHFGHQKYRWNPKMAPYIYGVRSGIHILDLSKTMPLFRQALAKVYEVASKGGRILFVGTKRQASQILAEEAKRCAQYYVNYRWLGGALTNWQTVSQSIRRLSVVESILGEEDGTSGLTKKEILKLTREREKLDLSLGGIRDMGGVPSLIFVIDTNKENIAIREARKLRIPIIGILDSNSDPDDVDYPIPGNDDATRAISLYCRYIADAVLRGIADSQAKMGIDTGASTEPSEPVLEASAKQKPITKEAEKKKSKKVLENNKSSLESKSAESQSLPTESETSKESQKKVKVEDSSIKSVEQTEKSAKTVSVEEKKLQDKAEVSKKEKK